jgi:hypothetical protein
MLTVPGRYTEGYFLLYSTPSGARLLEKSELAAVVGMENIGLNAYGRTMSSNTIELTTATLPAAQQACLLAHELTHCLDMGFWNVTPETITAVMTGATEINAHYNQGLIARELGMRAVDMELTWSSAVSTMNNSYTTFGLVADAWERKDVIEFLVRPGSFYRENVEALSQSKPLYVWGRDDDWERGNDLFHCEQHLALNNPQGPAW